MKKPETKTNHDYRLDRGQGCMVCHRCGAKMSENRAVCKL